MRALLDTHIALWALEGSDRLPALACEILLDPGSQVFYSVASVWEVAIKHAAHPDRMLTDAARFDAGCQSAGYSKLPIDSRHVFALGTLTRPAGAPGHNDLFDRLLIAQAKAEPMTLLTHDARLPEHGERCVMFV